MARCRGVVPNMNGRPWAKSKIGYKDKIANLKQGKCMWVVLVPRLKEIVNQMVTTIVNENIFWQLGCIKAYN